MMYAEIILPLAVKEIYTYIVPSVFEMDIQIGMRVVVPFRTRKFYTGIVYKLHNNIPDYPDVKSVSLLLDEVPIVNEYQLRYWEFLSSYYCCSLGDIYRVALPSVFRLESESMISKNSSYEHIESLTTSELQIFNALEDDYIYTVEMLISATNIKNPMPYINRLVEKDAIIVQEHLNSTYKPKYVDYIELGIEYRTDEALHNLLDVLGKRAVKQRKAVEFFVSYITERGAWYDSRVEKSLFMEKSGIGSSIVKNLIDKGVFSVVKIQVNRMDFRDMELCQPHELTEEQSAAYDSITSQFAEGKNIILLHGVTASGKTEVYIRLIQDAIKRGKQVLMLVPEISLTAQLAQRMRGIFGDTMCVYHSRCSDYERFEIWNDMLRKKRYSFVLGTKTSVFLPFYDLELIIVDEEHDMNYKQHDPLPRYNAKHSAIMLASMLNSKTLLGSATPSVESYCNAASKKYGLVSIVNRYGDMSMPSVSLIDMTEVYKKNMLKGHFSYQLIESVNKTLAAGEQVILFQNKRGYASYVQCHQCGYVPKCPNCDVSLTYHKTFNRLTCHYCNYTIPLPSQCPQCNAEALKTHGFGTEQVETEASELFPNAKIARMDLDTTRGKNSFDDLFQKFKSGKIDILIGTQMVSKGLDFDNVGLVGVMNADNLLYYPDFRAQERAYQMLVQVSGRAGRSANKGQVLIQTSMPKEPIMQYILQNDYWSFFVKEMTERKMFKYPPYYRLIRLTVKHRDSAVLDSGIALFADALRKSFGDRVLGPDMPIVGRIQNMYLKNIILKIENTANSLKAKSIIENLANNIHKIREYRNLIISIDVDPM